jgi:flavorubredoxin
VTALLGKVAALGIKPDIIAPDHGPLWFSGTATGPDWVTGLWKDWAEGRNRDSVVILYDTMWNSTGLMARAIAEGAASLGVPVRVFKAGNAHRSVTAHAMLSAGAVALGSPTLNNGIFPALSDHIEYLRGLRFHDRACAAFGSHGWSGEAVPLLDRELSVWKGVPAGDSLAVKFAPAGEVLAKCRELGVELARAVRA